MGDGTTLDAKSDRQKASCASAGRRAIVPPNAGARFVDEVGDLDPAERATEGQRGPAPGLLCNRNLKCSRPDCRFRAVPFDNQTEAVVTGWRSRFRSFRGFRGRRTGRRHPANEPISHLSHGGRQPMARTSTYLHFGGTAEAAFAFYKAAFGTEFVGPIERMGDLPAQPG